MNFKISPSWNQFRIKSDISRQILHVFSQHVREGIRVRLILTGWPLLHCQERSAGFLLFRPTQKYRLSLQQEQGSKHHSHSRNSINLLNLHNGLNSTAHRPSMKSESGDARVYFNIRVKCWVFMWTIRGSMHHVSVTFYRTYVHACIPDGFSHDAVQGPHLTISCEAGQVGSKSLTEPLSFIPGALPAQPFLMKHLTRSKSNLKQLLKRFQ